MLNFKTSLRTSLTGRVAGALLLLSACAGVAVADGHRGGYGGYGGYGGSSSVPAPTVTALSPTTAVAGGTGATTLSVTGTGFTTGSVVYFGETPLPTTDVSATQLTATLPATAISQPRTVSVVVSNGRGYGGQSNATAFTVTPSSPAPTITSLSSTTAVAGTAAFSLTVTGTNFLPTSLVYFGETPLTPTAQTTTSLTVTVPATAISRPRTVSVVVSNGRGYGGPSNAATFTVTPASPAPTLTGLSPSAVIAGSSAVTVTVTGTNFVTGSVVYFGEQALATTYVSATSLTAVIPAGALAYPGSAPVVVSNGLTSGYSNAIAFTVTPPTTQVFYQIGWGGNTTNAGIAVTYQAAATAALDLTQPLSLSVATATGPVFQAGPLTLSPVTYTSESGTSVTYYQYRSSTLLVTVVPQANNQYAVQLEAQGVNLSSVNTTLPVTVTLTLGGQTFTAQTQPVAGRD